MDGSERTKRRDGFKAGILRRIFEEMFRLKAFAGADSDTVDAGELFWTLDTQPPLSKGALERFGNQPHLGARRVCQQYFWDLRVPHDFLNKYAANIGQCFHSTKRAPQETHDEAYLESFV